MSEENPFSPAKRAAMREEIRREGMLADRFLGSDPDVPTFGLNLACAWPFPEAWRASYKRLAQQFGAFGDGVYAYPFAFTHVTLMTLVSFTRHVRPAPEFVRALEAKIPEIIALLSPLSTGTRVDRIKSFALESQTPVLARGAGILPLLNPDGEVRRLRERALALLQQNSSLHRELVEGGLNVPGIIHSTVLRFRQTPPDLEKFLAAFDEITADVKFPPMEVEEIFLTSETKPYMRAGEVLRRFTLKAGSP